MQAEEGSNTIDDHLTAPSNDKSNSAKQDGVSDVSAKEEQILKNGNGVHDESEICDGQSNGSRSRNSPIAEQEVPGDAGIVGQPLNFQLGSDVPNSISGNNYWQIPSQEDANVFQNFQPMNHPTMPPNYSLNNNNSFPQPMPFGSIGQPTNFMPNNHGQFSSPPGMHGMIGNVGSMNGPMNNMSYPNSHSQNQRRAITAQHNFGPMGGKSMNARFPWNQQATWPNNTQQAAMSPWTMALQQQKAMNRGGGVNMSVSGKKGQSNIQQLNHTQPVNNSMMSQQKYSKRSSPVPGNMSGSSAMKPGYAGASEDGNITYHTQVCC